MANLRSFIDIASADYRDVLAHAEYPEEFAASFQISPEERHSIQQRDRNQYLDWLISNGE
jgi:hypothetical protein